MAQGSGGRTEASVEGLGYLAIPRFVDDTVNRLSPAVGYRNHSEWDKCRTQGKHTNQQRCDKYTYEPCRQLEQGHHWGTQHTLKQLTHTHKHTEASLPRAVG